MSTEVTKEEGPFTDRFTDFTGAVAAYRKQDITADQLVLELGKPMPRRTPNPQRICVVIAIANIIGPIVMSMMQPPGVWIPIPLPAFCTTPVPPASVTNNDVKLLTEAVVAGMFD